MINYRVVGDKVDNSAESVFFADGKADGNGVGLQSVFHHLYGVVEVSAVDIHFVYVRDTRNVIFVRLTPYRFGLRFNAALGAESRHGSVENSQRSFNFDGEVNVSRSIDDVNSVAFPETSGSGRTNRYTSFLFLYHEVHRCGSVVNFAEFMSLSRVEKNTLGRSSLTRVDVRHDTDVSGML